MIGRLGQTGNATGQPASEAHVHFEVVHQKAKVDPRRFSQFRSEAVVCMIWQKKRGYSLLLALLASDWVALCGPDPVRVRDWRPGSYHGLVVGRSTSADATSILGPPRFRGTEQDTGTPILTFHVSDPTIGTLVVYLEHGLISMMRLDVERTITRAEVVRLFGADYIMTRYAVDDCLTSGGSAPIFESAQGSIVEMEYRARGLAAELVDGGVKAILYVRGPLGSRRSGCPPIRGKSGSR